MTCLHIYIYIPTVATLKIWYECLSKRTHTCIMILQGMHRKHSITLRLLCKNVYIYVGIVAKQYIFLRSNEYIPMCTYTTCTIYATDLKTELCLQKIITLCLIKSHFIKKKLLTFLSILGRWIG